MLSRRQVLGLTGAVTTSLAGCIGLGGDGPTGDDLPEGTQFDAEWQTIRHDDANTGYLAIGERITDPVVQWEATVGTPPVEPTVADGTVFSAAGQTYDATSGSGGWALTDRDWHPPALVDGTAYTPAPDESAMLGLDTETGDEVWRVELSGRATTPPVFDSRREHLFVAVRGGTLCGVDIGDESVEWTSEVFGEVTTPLAFNLATLFATTDTGEVYCFLENGTPRWRHDLQTSFEAPPVVGEERVYVAGMDGRVTALGRQYGEEVWHHTENGFVDDAMAFDGERLYTGTGSLTAYDAADGKVLWEYHADDGDEPDDTGVRCAPTVVGDSVYVGTQSGAVAALDVEGGGLFSDRERWRVDVGTFVGHGIAADGQRIYAPAIADEEDGGLIRLVSIENDAQS